MGCGASTQVHDESKAMERHSGNGHMVAIVPVIKEPPPPPPSNGKLELRREKSKEFLPVITGKDQMSCDDDDTLMEHENSMKLCPLPYVPAGMRIAIAPGRRLHRKHIENLNTFLRSAESNGDEISARVDFKRDVHEIKMRASTGSSECLEGLEGLVLVSD